MALITDPDDLNQGASLAVATAIFATGSTGDIRIHTSAANLLPALADGEFFEVRDHSDAVNNGLYQVETVTTSTDDYECDKVFGSAPIVASVEAITVLGATGTSTEKSIFIGTDTLQIALLEQGNLSVDGVTGQAVYSHCMKAWHTDDYLIASGKFPMLTIDADAGKFVIGQDNQGNNNGFNWADDEATFSIRTRKLLRSTGWDEVTSAGITSARWVGIGTLGGFENEAADKARYNFGTDTTVNNSVEFDFAGPVNEAIQYFEEIGNPTGCDFATASTITRSSGDFTTDGYIVGGQVTIRGAENAAHDGSFVVSAVVALTLTVEGTPFTSPDPDATAQLSVDNSNAIRIRNRIRDGDPEGKTYTQANLGSGNYSVLRSGFMTFPLSSVTDSNIDATDAFIDGNTPYTNMTLTFHTTPTSLGSDLVGGPYNFGWTLDAATGTQQQAFEWLQRQLRKTTNIDDGAGTYIGLMIDDLATFVGPQLQLGISSPTDGSVYPTNPAGGGSGIYVTNLAAASKNTTVMYDNTNTERGFPIGTPLTIDVNQTFIDDTTSIVKLYYDHTISNTVGDLVVTAGTGADGTFVSAGSALPATLDQGVGAYVRVSNLTGADEPMNGIYQVTALTSQALWSVTRRDGATIVTAAETSCEVDENCVDTPDAIIVDTDNALVASATVDFTAPDTIDDSGSGLAIFAVGDFIRIEGTAGHDGIYEIATSSAAQLTTVEQTILTEGTSSFDLTEVFEHAADADYSATYDYSNNDQGGRTPPVDADVVAKGIGAAVLGVQYATSSTVTVPSATATTVPLTGSLDRNFTD